MSKEEIQKQINHLKFQYLTCTDSNKILEIEYNLDYFYDLLNRNKIKSI